MQSELLWGFLQLPFRIQLSQVRSMTSHLLTGFQNFVALVFYSLCGIMSFV